MKKITKIASVTMYIVLLLTVVFTVLTLVGGSVEGDTNETPVYLDTLMNFTYVLVGATLGILILFEIFHVVTNPANAKRTAINLVIVAAVIGVARIMADGTPLKIIGYEGSDNVPSMLILTDVGMYVFYILFGVTLAVILFAEISKNFK
ncbi:MAG: hypothetical protein JXR39_06490 [Marinilabiliaceae bacterium]|nr:hypothetical protein [Marinilabiliaceae bacterium]